MKVIFTHSGSKDSRLLTGCRAVAILPDKVEIQGPSNPRYLVAWKTEGGMWLVPQLGPGGQWCLAFFDQVSVEE